MADLIACGAPVVTIVGKTWDAQVERALQTTLEENLRMIGESVAHLKAAGRHVVFDAEHYFDGFKANRDYALACVGAAVEAGADSVDLVDLAVTLEQEFNLPETEENVLGTIKTVSDVVDYIAKQLAD